MRLQTEIAEISSRKVSRPSPTNNGTGSMSTYYLQKLLKVTQDRTSQKNEGPTGRPRLNSKMKPNAAQSFTHFDKAADDLARLKDRDLKGKLNVSQRVDPSSPFLSNASKEYLTPTKPAKQDADREALLGIGQSDAAYDRLRKGADLKESPFKGCSKSYYLQPSSPFSDRAGSSSNNSSAREGDYSGIESKSKTKEVETAQEDKGVIDKFSKWIKRIGPKY